MDNPNFSSPDHGENDEPAHYLENYDTSSISSSHLKSLSSQNYLVDEREEYLQLKRKADEGNADAQFLVGSCFKNGKGVSKSYKNASYYFKLAADQGCSQAQLSLALLYDEGLGVEQDPLQAFHYAKLAADQGYSLAYVLLGKLYAQGKGTQKSSEQAIHYYKLAADQGETIAQSSLAHYLLENKINEDQAVHYLKLAIQTRDCSPFLLACCEHDLAQCYENGVGVERNDALAEQHYKMSSDIGNGFGSRNLALFYEKHNPTLAIEYYKKAVDQGNDLCLEDLGRCYEKGIGVPRNTTLAVKYYKMSSDQGCKYGSKSLARCYEKGIGVPRNPTLAEQYYKMSSDRGCSYGSQCLALFYEKHNPTLAIEYYKKAVDQGNDSCLEDLGRCYEKGIGVPRNPALAVKYYKMSSDQGWSYGSKSLARCYEKGIGVKFSPALAVQYYRLAKEQGNDSAFQHIRLRLNELPDGAQAVYLHTPEITEGKYPSICISFIWDLENKKEEEVNSLFSFEVFGILHIIDRKIHSLSITQNMVDYLENFGIKQMYLVIGGEVRVVDQPIKTIVIQSSETYQNLCSQISVALRKLDII